MVSAAQEDGPANADGTSLVTSTAGKSGMMKVPRFPHTTQIKQMRAILGITQSSLAKRSGVSQSTIAKIERGKVKGSYNEVVKLFEALDDEAGKRSKRVRLKDIATRKIISVQVNEPVRKASELMREHDISQMPVFESDRPVGSISERAILDQMLSGASADEVGRRPVWSLIEGPFPVIDEDVEKRSVETLLVAEHAVLTARGGKITGIVTSADLIQVDWVI